MNVQCEEGEVVVIDSGSLMCRVGFAGDDAPRRVFRSLVGRRRECADSDEQEGCYVGEQTLDRRLFLTTVQPIERGIVTNWSAMEEIWRHIFYTELRIAPQEHPILMTEGPLNPKGNREQMTRVMFETFKVPALYVANQAVLALFCSGRTTGMVVESGEGASCIVPIFQSYPMPHAVLQLDYAGLDLTEYMMEMLSQRGDFWVPGFDLGPEIARDIKNSLAYVALDYDTELQASFKESQREARYELPCGPSIAVGSERFRCPEALFQPSLIGKEGGGIHEATFQSIVKCAADIRKELLGNVVLSGGNTMFGGICERMTAELQTLAPDTMVAKVVGVPERKYAAWIGGSILGSLDCIGQISISSEEYEKFGPKIVHTKCLF